MFNTFDDVSRSVSDFHYQVFHPACSDTFYISDDAWENLKTPPLPLEERYFSCKPFVRDALFNSLGIAAGNTATMVPLLCLCFLPLLYVYLQAAGRVPPKAEYTPAELDAAIRALSLMMLRIRDGKIRGIKKGSVLQVLTTDLIAAAKAEGGYPDSDDDSDDEEDEDVESSEEQRSQSSIAQRRKSFVRDSSKNNAKSAVFIKPEDEDEHPVEQAGFWTSFFSRSDESAATEARQEVSKNPMVELAINSSEIFALNEGLAGASARKSKIKNIPAENYLQEVATILSAMQRAEQVQGMDGAASAYKIAKIKTEILFQIQADNRDVYFDRGALFSQLYDILLIHVSLEHQCTRDKAVDSYSNQAAYNVGGRIYTATDLLLMKEKFL
jgi:hypothetical protein